MLFDLINVGHKLKDSASTWTARGLYLVRSENYEFSCWETGYSFWVSRGQQAGYLGSVADIVICFQSTLKTVSLMFKYLGRKLTPFNLKIPTLLVRTELGLWILNLAFKTCLENLKREEILHRAYGTFSSRDSNDREKTSFLRKLLIMLVALRTSLTPFIRKGSLQFDWVNRKSKM